MGDVISRMVIADVLQGSSNGFDQVFLFNDGHGVQLSCFVDDNNNGINVCVRFCCA